MPSPDILRTSLAPFILKNSLNSTNRLLNTFKSPYTYLHSDLNKFIDRINDAIRYRKSKIRDLGGYTVEDAFDQKLINKYIKDIPSK